jgi:hypothetical protein
VFSGSAVEHTFDLACARPSLASHFLWRKAFARIYMIECFEKLSESGGGFDDFVSPMRVCDVAQPQ